MRKCGTDPFTFIFQALLGQSLPSLDVGRITLIDQSPTGQPEERLDLADDFAAGGFGFEQLPEEALESQPQREDAVAAVRTFFLRGEQGRGQEVVQVLLELRQGGLAEGLSGPAAQGGQAGAQSGEIRSVHKAVYIPPY